jgi:7-keto-8-aminopelargonate synthetase-like enzyme
MNIDMNDLEKKLRNAIVRGHLRTNRPWKKIIIVVEGVYRLI